MVRLGEKIIALTTQGINSGMVGISIRDPQVGQSILAIPNGTGGTISVCPFNAYEGDEGVAVPLPCGCSVFLAGEPPNYLPPSWESGFRMSCQQGVPSTTGWTCSSGCPINPTYHPTAAETCRNAYGLYMYYRNPNACTHAQGSAVWRGNAKLHRDVIKYYYNCGQRCTVEELRYNPNTGKYEPTQVPCRYYGTERSTMTNLINGNTYGNEPPSGCVYPSRRYRTRYEYLALDENGNLVAPFYSYSCNGCGYYGKFPVCTIKGSGDKGPAFTGPGAKPGGCKYQGSLNFDGWVLSGGQDDRSTSCVLEKATEGARSESDDVIRCKFMSG